MIYVCCDYFENVIEVDSESLEQDEQKTNWFQFFVEAGFLTELSVGWEQFPCADV